MSQYHLSGKLLFWATEFAILFSNWTGGDITSLKDLHWFLSAASHTIRSSAQKLGRSENEKELRVDTISVYTVQVI